MTECLGDADADGNAEAEAEGEGARLIGDAAAGDSWGFGDSMVPVSVVVGRVEPMSIPPPITSAGGRWWMVRCGEVNIVSWRRWEYMGVDGSQLKTHTAGLERA